MESFPQRSRISARRLRDPWNWTEARSTNNWVRNSQISPFRHKWGKNVLFWSVVPSTSAHFYALTRPPNLNSDCSVARNTAPSRQAHCHTQVTRLVLDSRPHVCHNLPETPYTIPSATLPKYIFRLTS